MAGDLDEILPREMSMRHYPLLVLAFILTVCAYTAAQPKDAKSIAARNASDKAARDLETERVLKERRANAQSLLINLAADARNFTEQALRARTQARIADVLWEVDRERSRTMFRSAWDAAEVADAENWARVQEDIRQQQAKSGSGGYVMASPPDLRREVLRLAGKHDRALGEEFLARFKEQKAQEATDAKKTRPGPFGNSDDATRQRFDLARQLLEAGDPERAMQFADPVLGIPGMPAIDFLSYLREKSPVAADQRYAAMLASAAANPQSDANTVSLLSSYLFTPHVFIAFVSTGTYTTSSGGPIELPAVAPELRLAFFSAASSILMRPLAPPGQEQTSSGHDGDYLVIKRLLPLFEQYAPPEMTTALRAQLEALSSLASKGTRERDDDDWVRKGIRPDKFDQNWEQSLLDKLDHARTSAERDQINFQLAGFFAAKSDLKARDYVSKIDDTEMRNGARAYIDASMTLRAIEKKDAERALEIVRNGELTHLQKSWAFSQSAELLAKTDRERALALIEDAAAEARRIENSDPDRPRAFFGVTNALFLIDRKSAWQMIDDAIRSANSAEDFSGEDGQLTFRMITKGMRSINQSSAPDFDVTGIFDAFAREDYEKAVELARGFQHDAPRASATIAIARSVLDEKKK
jgi:hypothetical protein